MPEIESEEELKQKIADSQAALDKAKSDLAAFQAAAKADDVFVKLWKAYDKAQFDLEGMDDALRENQGEEQTKLAAKLGTKAAAVDAAVAACEKEVADRRKDVEDAKAAVAAQQDAVDKARKAETATKDAFALLSDAVKLIQAKHKKADALRLQAVAARKAGNVALAYYLVKTSMKAELDTLPPVYESDDYFQAVKDAASADAAAVAAVTGAERVLKDKQAAQTEAEKKLAVAAKDLPAKIEEALVKIKAPAPGPAPAPAPVPEPAPEPDPEGETP